MNFNETIGKPYARSSSLRQPLLGQNPPQTRRQSRQARKAKKEADVGELTKYQGCGI